MQLSNQPPKGTYDWFPEELKIRQYIFNKWREVCLKFGYEEYLTPVFENAEIYKAKSGEDIGGKELMVMIDKAGRELAIRPEMTPSVTRMVTQKYQQMPKPIKYFSIANYVRNEKPQRGRNREFWQLNCDIFGSNSVNSDIDTLVLAIEIMLAFNPPANSFVVNINNRKLIDAILTEVAEVSGEIRTDVVRILDKFEKLPPEEFTTRLRNIGLSDQAIDKLQLFMSSQNAEELIQNLPEIQNNSGFTESLEIINTLKELGYTTWINFNPSIIRGFDYYDGMVFEVFDNNPENNRAMFGGGRYNGLAKLFVSYDIPAVGFAPGDEPMRLFLESWNIIPVELFDNEFYYLPLLDETIKADCFKLAQRLRNDGKQINLGYDVESISKALSFANNKKYKYVIIYGTNELSANKYIIKDMISGEQIEINL